MLGSTTPSEKTVETVWPARWGQERRLEFIEFRLLWDGRLNRADLTSFFGISVPQASMDLAKYMELAPENMSYDRQEKAYLIASGFSPALGTGDSHVFLNQIRQIEAGMLTRESTFIGWYPPAGVVRHPTRKVDPGTLRAVLLAIRRKETLRINYQSMNRPDPATRDISPHAIVFDGVRWHVRAFCSLRKDYRDFVLARILEFEKGETAAVAADADSSWSNIIEVRIRAKSDLPLGQRRAIELDYGMDNGSLGIETREALLFYVLQQLCLLPDQTTQAPFCQLELVNTRALSPFLGAFADA